MNSMAAWMTIVAVALVGVSIVGLQVWLVWRAVMSGGSGNEMEVMRSFGPVNGMLLLGVLRGTTVGLLVGAVGNGVVLGIAAAIRGGVAGGIASLLGGALIGGVAGAAGGAVSGLLWGLVIRWRWSEQLARGSVALAGAAIGGALATLFIPTTVALAVGAVLVGAVTGVVAWRWQPSSPRLER